MGCFFHIIYIPNNLIYVFIIKPYGTINLFGQFRFLSFKNLKL